MFESQEIRDEIYESMDLKSTEELQQIWDEHDTEEWTDVAFEVVRKILIQRTGEIPVLEEMNYPIPEEWNNIDWSSIIEKLKEQNQKRSSMIFFFGVFLIVVVFFYLLFRSVDFHGSEIPLLFWLIFAGMLVFLGLLIGLVSINPAREYLVVRAKVLLIAEPTGQTDPIKIQLSVLNSMEITPEGELIEFNGWKDHQSIEVSSNSSIEYREREVVDLLCYSNARVIGLLDDYLDIDPD